MGGRSGRRAAPDAGPPPRLRPARAPRHHPPRWLRRGSPSRELETADGQQGAGREARWGCGAGDCDQTRPSGRWSRASLLMGLGLLLVPSGVRKATPPPPPIVRRTARPGQQGGAAADVRHSGHHGGPGAGEIPLNQFGIASVMSLNKTSKSLTIRPRPFDHLCTSITERAKFGVARKDPPGPCARRWVQAGGAPLCDEPEALQHGQTLALFQWLDSRVGSWEICVCHRFACIFICWEILYFAHFYIFVITAQTFFLQNLRSLFRTFLPKIPQTPQQNILGDCWSKLKHVMLCK